MALVLATLSCATSSGKGGALADARRVDFLAADGKVGIRIDPRDGLVRVEGRRGTALATVRGEGDRLAVADANGRTVYYVERPGSEERRLHVRSAADERVVYELKLDPDGDLKVRDESGRRISAAKRRDYGYKVVSGDGETVARVRARSGKISVRDPSGATYLSTRASIPPDAVALLILEALPIEAAAGLGVALAFWSPPEAPAPP